MMIKPVLRTALGALALTLTTSAMAQVTAEDMIKYRKAGYSFMAWNMGKIKAQVVDGSVPFDQAQVAASANAIAAIAGSGMGALYGPGTDKDVGEQKTRVKPELFQNMPDVGQLAGEFVAATAALQSAAAEGNQDAIKTAFGKVGETCKACHDKYRVK